MSTPRSNADAIEQLLDRVSAATEQITKASKQQAREVDRQLKQILDRGEASTERVVARIDKQLRAQITGLRRELRSVERHIDELRAAGAKKVATSRAKASKARAKPVGRKAATRKTAAKKAPAKKAATKRTAAAK